MLSSSYLIVLSLSRSLCLLIRLSGSVVGGPEPNGSFNETGRPYDPSMKRHTQETFGSRPPTTMELVKGRQRTILSCVPTHGIFSQRPPVAQAGSAGLIASAT